MEESGIPEYYSARAEAKDVFTQELVRSRTGGHRDQLRTYVGDGLDGGGDCPMPWSEQKHELGMRHEAEDWT